MVAPQLSIEQFSEQELVKAFANRHAPESEVAAQGRIRYLAGYLRDIKAESIVIEEPYIDGDYLDDYAAYYAKCFQDYGRWCKRLHFFDVPPAGVNIPSLLEGASEAQIDFLQEHYLGFVVTRPLPEAVVGRTVLRTYDSDNGRRSFPVTRRYSANLCGAELEIESLAFQEQDTVLAACATVAVWSCFHKTAELFHTAIPTPAEITRIASQAVHYGRSIPSAGLRVEEICAAVRHLHLEPELIELRGGGMVPLPSLIRGYLLMGLPVLLVIEIPDVGLHAVTISGYSVLDVAARPEEVPGYSFIPMVGRRIDKFYAHDDQVGPFSRMIIHGCNEQTRSGFLSRVRARFLGSSPLPFPICLETSWANDHDMDRPVYPYAVIVPVYPKIRLRFIDILKWLTPLNPILSNIIPPDMDHEWDVHLTLSNDYKSEVRADVSRSASARRAILSCMHPRFWWRAVLSIEGEPCLELLFDATGIARSFPLTEAIWLSEPYSARMETILANGERRDEILKDLSEERSANSFIVSRLLEFLPGSIRRRDNPLQEVLHHNR
jgi:hypothetical protein